MEKRKRRWGDRKDGVLLRDLDGMHFITPLIYPNRCDNEAYIRETIDLTNMNAFLKKKNESETEFPYTMFHIIVAGLVKTITLRPKMNRFIANKNFYQRNEVSMSFVVKKQFADEAAEALAAAIAKQEEYLAMAQRVQAGADFPNDGEHDDGYDAAPRGCAAQALFDRRHGVSFGYISRSPALNALRASSWTAEMHSSFSRV